MVTQRDEPTDVYRALADPTRRAILRSLIPGERAVNRIAEGFDVSRPAISKHLRLLREADLVRETKRGKRRFYRLNAEPLREVDDWLAEYRAMWSTQLERLKRYLEEENP